MTEFLLTFKLITKKKIVKIILKMLFKCFVTKNSYASILQRRFIKTLSLKFAANGEPNEVLKMIEEELPEPNEFQVLIKVLLAPINPSDINAIQGRYPLQPAKPATAGNEFVGKIIKMGSRVTNFVLSEHVVAFESGLGTWSKYLLLDAKQVYGVPYEVPLPEAAILTVNPCSAYRMLKDFVKLGAGDCIIQNGANSSVGQMVHQLCKHWGIKSVAVVRDRPDIINLKRYLSALGATEVFTEAELVKTELFRNGCLPFPRLALDCVGGESATNIAKVLDVKGIMVTFGGMSRKPIKMSAGPLIFKRHVFCGFWLNNWVKNSRKPDRIAMLEDIIKLMRNGELKGPIHTLIPFHQYEEYFKTALTLPDKANKKFIFDMSDKECE